MLHPLRNLAAAMLLALAPAAVSADEAGDLVFTNRAPWELGDKVLAWSLTREGPQLPGFVLAKDGSVTLAEVAAESGEKSLQMVQKADEFERKIGPLPVASGDPVLVFFLENTARDMASLTGGSADYIRNRIKDAVFRGGNVTRSDGKVVAEMEPFVNDPNKERMSGFSTLKLTFVMDDDPKAPIREMHAETSEPIAPPAPREVPGAQIAPAQYRHIMVMK